MACLELHYHVTVHEKMQDTTERKETHIPVALGDLQGQGDFTADTESRFTEG